MLMHERNPIRFPLFFCEDDPQEFVYPCLYHSGTHFFACESPQLRLKIEMFP